MSDAALTERPRFVVCPQCGKDMCDWDDGYYCQDYLIDEVDKQAIPCSGYLTYDEAQEQWDRRRQQDTADLAKWNRWASNPDGGDVYAAMVASGREAR